MFIIAAHGWRQLRRPPSGANVRRRRTFRRTAMLLRCRRYRSAFDVRRYALPRPLTRAVARRACLSPARRKRAYAQRYATNAARFCRSPHGVPSPAHTRRSRAVAATTPTSGVAFRPRRLPRASRHVPVAVHRCHAYAGTQSTRTRAAAFHVPCGAPRTKKTNDKASETSDSATPYANQRHAVCC